MSDAFLQPCSPPSGTDGPASLRDFLQLVPSIEGFDSALGRIHRLRLRPILIGRPPCVLRRIEPYVAVNYRTVGESGGQRPGGIDRVCPIQSPLRPYLDCVVFRPVSPSPENLSPSLGPEISAWHEHSYLPVTPRLLKRGLISMHQTKHY